MKYIIRNVGALIIIVLLSSVIFFPVACKRGGPSDAVITVLDSLGKPVAGATVKLTAPPKGGSTLASYLPDIQVTGSDGKTVYSFPLEAVLTAQVSKGNLMVFDIVRLKREDSITQTIILK